MSNDKKNSSQGNKKGFGSKGGPGARHKNIIVTKAVRREQIDYEKLAAALVKLATDQLRAKRNERPN